MAVSRSVQFRGVPAVLRAYENANIAPFAIMCGTQLLMKYEDNDLEGGKEFLKTALKELSTGGGMATYTLCVYEDLKPKEKIKSKTPFDMSFNFKLEEYETERAGRFSNREYEDRIAALEAKLKLEEDETDEPEAIGGIWGTIGKLLEHPDISAAIAGKIVTAIHSVGASNPSGASVLTAVPGAAKVAGAGDRHNSEQLEKIRRAVDTLAKLDPDLGDHLIQIAEIAMKDPGKYNLLIGMLKNV